MCATSNGCCWPTRSNSPATWPGNWRSTPPARRCGFPTARRSPASWPAPGPTATAYAHSSTNSSRASCSSRNDGRPPMTARRGLSRRRFLRGAGTLLSLPLLDAMRPAFANERTAPDAPPRRMLAVCNNLGLLPERFFPTQAGRGYALSPYLEILRDFRDDLTVFSGVWHPDVDGGHPADNCFLTAAPHPGSGNFRNTISLDQFMAERIGPRTRYPSLNLGVNVQHGLRSLAWTGSGVMIPCDDKASDVFRRLFLQGTP